MHRLLYLTQHDFIFTVTSRVESTSITVNMSVIVICFSAAGGCIVPLFITPIHFLTKSVGGPISCNHTSIPFLYSKVTTWHADVIEE